jgi:F-type H+-transporting ATPase subunit b
MDLITPSVGLIFWNTVVFLVLLFLLSRFAWKPILGAVKKREASINNALEAAERAKEEMSRLQNENEALLQQARAERDQMLKEARETREKMVADAKAKANEESERILASARETIRNEKMAAIAELKNQVATLSIEIAERIVREQLSSNEKQQALASTLVEDMNLN